MKQVLQELHNCCTVAAHISILFQLAANDGVLSSTPRYAVIGCKLKQNANEGCNSCATLAGLVLCFIACFILLVIAPECPSKENAVFANDFLHNAIVQCYSYAY